MTNWICATCGIEQDDTPQPPETCPICADERQYLPPDGQQWTTLEALQRDRAWQVEEIEPDLYAITVSPKVGIGQRGLLVRTGHGNVLWECPGYLDDGLVARLNGLGGVAAITASHPHLTGISVTLSQAFGDVPVYWAADDASWLQRHGEEIRLWRGTQEVVPGVTLYQCGGHFAGSAVLHWPAGAAGHGVLLTGDTCLVGADRATVGFMRSYPNRIPLSARSVRRIAETVAPLPFDRLYCGFAGVIETGAAEAVQYSAQRHIGWVTDAVRDPADA